VIDKLKSVKHCSAYAVRLLQRSGSARTFSPGGPGLSTTFLPDNIM